MFQVLDVVVWCTHLFIRGGMYMFVLGRVKVFGKAGKDMAFNEN